MIGGYLYRRVDREINDRLQTLLSKSRIFQLWDMGFFFCINSFHGDQEPFAMSPDLAVMSTDMLVGTNGGKEYRKLDLETDFMATYRRDGIEALNEIQCDVHMAIASRTKDDRTLLLVSHRAGSGRIYYHKLAGGIVFSSDLRFLLNVIPLDVNPLGIYSLLKYGSILEPLTISRNISAVPVAHFAKYDLSQGEDSLHPHFKFRFARDAVDTPEIELDGVQAVLKQSAAYLGSYSSAMLLSGGIDSSLYGCYLNLVRREPMQAFYCAFGMKDPEYPYAAAIAKKLGLDLKVATMEKSDALQSLDDVVRLTDHPFSDFSSIPIVFLLKFIRRHLSGQGIVVECNGGDDCFGFPALQDESKYRMKHCFPEVIKKIISACFRNSPRWKWESYEGMMARIAALADVHEQTPLNYFLVLAPVNYLALDRPREWDETLQELIEKTASSCGENYSGLGYEAKITIRQLFYVNSARWAAKALSVGESLGLRIMYPYIWRDVLQVQGMIPWHAKVHNGTVKWPLKKLLENFMPEDFIYRKKSGFVPPLVHWLTDPAFNQKVRDIVVRSNGAVSQVIPVQVLDELLADALDGKRLRYPVLNMLWGAIFAESWIQEYGGRKPLN